MSGRLRVLTVHGVGPPPRPLAPGEARTWVDVTRFERVLDACAGRRDVRLTFDDGNASDVGIALPRLLERGLTAEFFVLAGRLGEPGMLDEDGVGALRAAGMRIGSHGWAHRDWRALTGGQARQELLAAPARLAALVGAPVRRVAVPFGSYDRRVLARLRAAGVERVYTSDGGSARDGGWLQPRTSLHRELDERWLRAVLDGVPAARLRARRRVAALVKRCR